MSDVSRVKIIFMMLYESVLNVKMVGGLVSPAKYPTRLFVISF